MDMEFDLDDLKPTAIKRLLKRALVRGGKDEDKKRASDEDADKEQEDLAELHSEKGDSKAPKVETDDIPVVDRKVAAKEHDEDEEDDDEKPDFKKKKTKSPMKKAKKSFPFQKKG
jgi:hypothetical protein